MTTTNPIPFLDLVAPHMELKEELCDVFRQGLETAGFIGGPMVEDFEQRFAEYCGTRYCAGVGSGTEALTFALIATGIGPGDIVITVPNTFIATAEAISQSGARPEFVDVDPRTHNMDPEKLRDYLERQCCDNGAGGLIHRRMRRRVSAVVPVHLYGQMADMDLIVGLAEQYGLTVIEDACQAHGAEYFSEQAGGWRKSGSLGKAAAFSFYPGKNLGACGEGGAVTTDDADLFQRVRMLRDHGQSQKYYHDMPGYNGRLDAIQAGVLSVKLNRLAGWNEQRRQAARRYRDLFSEAGIELELPHEASWSKAVYHLYVVRVDDREALRKHLSAAGIGTGIHYPVPIHLQNAYGNLGYLPGDFPVSEAAAKGVLSLPMFPELGMDEQARIVDAITSFLSASHHSEMYFVAGR